MYTSQAISLLNGYGMSVAPSTVRRRWKKLVTKNEELQTQYFKKPKQHVEDDSTGKEQKGVCQLSDDLDMEAVSKEIVVDIVEPAPSSQVLCTPTPNMSPQLESAESSSPKLQRCEYEVLGDNLDIMINPTVMTKEKQRQSLHWFLLIGKKKTVQCPELPDDGPKADITTLESSSWIPSTQEIESYDANFDFHTAKILTTHLSFLLPYSNSVPNYITHPYLDQTSKQNEILNCELMEESENSTQGMIKINRRIHEVFVPKDEKKKVLERIVFGGDVLTNERAFAAQSNVTNNKSSFSRDTGMVHRPEGLHREMNFVLVKS